MASNVLLIAVESKICDRRELWIAILERSFPLTRQTWKNGRIG